MNAGRSTHLHKCDAVCWEGYLCTRELSKPSGALRTVAIWERLTRTDNFGRERMTESKHAASPGADSGPESELSEWSQKRFFLLYAAVLIHTVGSIFALWLFSRMFD